MGQLLNSLLNLKEKQIIKSTTKYGESYDFFKIQSFELEDSQLIRLVLVKFYPEIGTHDVTLPIEPEAGWYISPKDSSFAYKFYESSYEEFLKDFIKKMQKVQDEQMKLLSFVVNFVILEKEIIEIA